MKHAAEFCKLFARLGQMIPSDFQVNWSFGGDGAGPDMFSGAGSFSSSVPIPWRQISTMSPAVRLEVLP